MFCRVSEGVEKWLGFDGRLCLEEFHATFDIDMWWSHEGAIGVNVVVEDNKADHYAQDKQMSFFALNLR